MGFSISTNGIPKLGNWATAEHHERTVAPIRGRTVKPLGLRRNHHTMRIERRKDDSIVCMYYTTDVVTFYKDGRIQLLTGGHTTVSTVKFMSAILDYGLHAHIQAHNAVLYQSKGYGHEGQWIIPSGGLILDAGKRTPLNPVPCMVHTVNRKGATQVRQMYAAFTTYVVGLCKLVGESEKGNFNHVWWRWGDAVLPHMDGTEPDYEAWGEAATRFIRASSRAQYNYTLNKVTYVALPKLAKKLIERQAYKRHRGIVFTPTELPLGKYKSDTYAKYFI